VPVLPLVGVLIERLCCAVLPDLFGRFAPEAAKGTTLNAARLGSAMGFAGRLDTKSLFSGIGARLDLAGRFAGDWLRAPVDDVPEKGRIPRDEVFGQQTPQVREKLEQLGATVAGVERYDPGTALLDVARPGALPGKVAPGERVILYEDREGVVRHWTVVKGAVADQPTIDIQDDLRRIDDTVRGLHETRELLTAARTEINTLRATLSRVETESNAAMGTRDRQIESLQTELARVERDSAAALESRDRNLRELQESSRKLESELGTIERLRADVELLKRRG
jgi:prefoldin subunit 5